MRHEQKLMKHNQRKYFIFSSLFTFSLGLFICFTQTTKAAPKAPYIWQEIKPGLRYTKYSFKPEESGWTTLHAFEVDLDKYKLEVLTASNEERHGTTVEKLAKKSKALLVINGGFFTEAHKSIGLLIQNKKKINPLHKTSWWSIFHLENKIAKITHPHEFQQSSNTQVAIQAGPRLVISGIIPKFRDSFAARSAIGINKEGKIILLISEGGLLSLKELARRFKANTHQGGFACDHAMNLDGGGSTQIFTQIGDFQLQLPGRSRITNGLGVFPK